MRAEQRRVIGPFRRERLQRADGVLVDRGGQRRPGREVAVEGSPSDAGGEAIASTESVSSEDGPERIVEAALRAWGRVDGYVANAAIVRNKRFDDLAAADWDDVLDVDLRGVFRGLQAGITANLVAPGRDRHPRHRRDGHRLRRAAEEPGRRAGCAVARG